MNACTIYICIFIYTTLCKDPGFKLLKYFNTFMYILCLLDPLLYVKMDISENQLDVEIFLFMS